ncbi:cytochrome P450 [Antarcticibacterium sp. 1MA-6-2]|uniref:cytochrome P450 n=1 Tax=Antarcticibacterium sp. 1MA-6-2 TaxID=2908210 RepID=UPI002882F032|nr:cytochrome P450 [Antarcticibacterium sp. 1MA-6-2]
MYEIHRSEEYWEDPEAFLPARFEDPKKHSSYYFPFGAGPRMCIGNNFAMYEMIMAVAELVRKYKISSDSTPIQILPLITLKPKQAILKFDLRNRE